MSSRRIKEQTYSALFPELEKFFHKIELRGDAKNFERFLPFSCVEIRPVFQRDQETVLFIDSKEVGR